ncbi:hypothetical protein TCAL_04001 [Tigriopus californicus]|uniref:Fatty acyl-CoA reductase n=1 Tax=Tigriopus californicus TaxID=6832 RepID=A0A553NFE3_TIGCA|nr:putative fatty acyl-CoA reductase CG5065 [Tigriopus californicus]TRY64151.1 hypothetical protein TCAL_04001 [Tigriopus californicus]|eukprot:TCALIF_04001-PA protein Name:"Similar to CG5065 Putative fatty acyl-CoA reductase CG5065 (Drosophila melanogaster)" AED:0.34 eAED:0.34 QI:437/1/1/1/1/1/2/102/489
MSGPVSEFFAGRTVFITGGSGFLGKVLIFKLLKSCPKIGEIWLLIREKRGQTPEERLQGILKSPMFKEVEGSLSKVKVITGDVSEKGLGLKPADRRKVIENISVVFHSAATIKFDEVLTKAVFLNVRGTRDLLNLAKNMVKLRAFIHVSTAYCNCHTSKIDESVLFAPPKAQDIIEMCETGDHEVLNSPEKTLEIIGDRPNSYTFTKAKAEELVLEAFEKIPTVVVRPSIVVAALQEPFPGWIDNMNGPTGMVVGAGSGFLRTMKVDRECKADLVPVDQVINLLCVAAERMSESRAPSLPVYNMCSGDLNPILWGQIESIFQPFLLEYPPEKMFWYPGGSFKKSAVVDMMCQIAFHYIPAYLTDLCKVAMGQKPYMVNILNKMVKAIAALEYFTNREWDWSTKNVRQLCESLEPKDRITFDFDVRAVDWKSFLRSYVQGTRHFVLKNDPNSMGDCRKKLQILKLCHYGLQVIMFVMIFNFFKYLLSFIY